MALLKRTYSLPLETLKRFESAVAPGKRSAAVARLMAAWAGARERAALRAGIVEGCEAMAEEYLEMEREFHPLEEEVQRALDS